MVAGTVFGSCYRVRVAAIELGSSYRVGVAATRRYPKRNDNFRDLLYNKTMKILIFILTVLILAGCPESEPSEEKNGSKGDGFGTADPAWSADSYNAKYRIFPNAPERGILTYPWGSGTDNYFDNNAPVSYWNDLGHNHKYPDLFHFANGNRVNNIADWENRREEIFNILQYYMHGRMPSIDPGVITIVWKDVGNTCEITIMHNESNRIATFNVTHTPPEGAIPGAMNRILLFGVGQNPAAREGWGRAAFQTSWAGSESTRAGTCATLYGLTPSALDTPSVNMQYAWAMSIILSVIEEGGLGGFYNPGRIGVYGFSRWGKGAMCIGAFAEGRRGSRIGFTLVGSAGSGGPSIDRWINQMGYKNHTEDPLPVEGGGVNDFNDLKGITWFMNIINDTPAAGSNANREAVRGWTAATPGIPAGSLIYNETFVHAKEPGPPNSWGRIQVLSQARAETPGWFSARFAQLNDLHSQARLDIGSGGILCTMPFDSHYLAALIAPRIIYYEDGYNTMRNNPESQWANWLICDEIYQMYAKELKDPSIIWRNAIKLYDIDHVHTAYQNQDEFELVTAVYGRTQPPAKFRTPPFPVDDPRYRWDFDRMDFGRPGHPTIAERVRRMRESPIPVKAMDTRGLLDSPEPL